MNVLGNKNSSSEALNACFRVVMDEFDEAIFQSCEGLESEIEVVFLPEGGRGGAPRAVRGAPKTNKLLFAKGNTGGKSGKKNLFEWFQEVCDYSKPLKRKTLTVQLLDSQKNAVRSWRVLDAWPCRWLGPALSRESSDLTVEYLEFAHEGITV